MNSFRADDGVISPELDFVVSPASRASALFSGSVLTVKIEGFSTILGTESSAAATSSAGGAVASWTTMVIRSLLRCCLFNGKFLHIRLVF